VHVKVNDGTSDSNNPLTTVTVAAQNDAPTLAANGSPASVPYTENGTAIIPLISPRAALPSRSPPI
jgi:hypothetical protein